jgi:hypothetical protein
MSGAGIMQGSPVVYDAPAPKVSVFVAYEGIDDIIIVQGATNLRLSADAATLIIGSRDAMIQLLVKLSDALALVMS